MAELVASWPVMPDATVAAWLAAALLSVTGVIALVRGEVFLGATLAQASALGMISAPWLAAALHAEHTALLGGDGFQYSLAVLFAATVAIVLELAFERREDGRIALGYVFLVATGLSVLIAGRIPGGREQLERLLASSTVAAGPAYVAVLSLALVLLSALLASSRRKLLLVVLDRPTAAAAGLHTGAWSMLLAAAVGTTVGLCVPIAGVAYAFACFLLPALVARNTCREIGSMFAVAPIVSVGCAVVAFVVAHRLEVPPAALAVLLQAFLVAPAWLLRRVRP